MISKILDKLGNLLSGKGGANVKALYKNSDYLEAYSKHTDLRVKNDPKTAIGVEWETVGQLQFDFMKIVGLKEQHSLFDLGCGTLRGGIRFIQYLDKGNYTGVDISSETIKYAKKLVHEENLSEKSPNLMLDEVKNFQFDQFGVKKFDYLLAQSVFTHLKPEHIEKCLANIRKIMHNDSKFCFTYFEGTVYKERSVKDFEYPKSFFEELAIKYHYKLTDHREEYPHPRKQIMLSITPA